MTENLKKAVNLLETGGYTCVMCKDDQIVTSTERGVKPLLNFIEETRNKTADFQGFSAADKIVGKAAAFLYLTLGVSEVYAEVLSESAQKLFNMYEIQHSCKTLTSTIINRKGTGCCPMEEAVKTAVNARQAELKIREKLAELKDYKN